MTSTAPRVIQTPRGRRWSDRLEAPHASFVSHVVGDFGGRAAANLVEVRNAYAAGTAMAARRLPAGYRRTLTA